MYVVKSPTGYAESNCRIFLKKAASKRAKAATKRAKAAGKKLLTGVIDDITQQGRGKRVYRRADTSKPRSEEQTKKRRTPRSMFKTIFD